MAPDIPAAPPAETQPIQEVMQQVRVAFDAAADPTFWLVAIQRTVLVAIALLFVLLALRVARKVLDNLKTSRALPEAAVLPLRRLVRWAILVVATLLILQFLGVPMATVWATVSAVAALIAVGFVAVWSVLSNVACALLLLIFKPFRIGDYIELVESAAGPNIGGRVTDLTLAYVVLREDVDGEVSLVQVPNNLFFQKTVRRQAGRRAVELQDHVDKHGLAGREKAPPERAEKLVA
jgi:small-conductance mechanosensitive channel